MNRWCLLMLLWVAAQCGAETLSHGRFQNLAVYRPGGEVQRVVLFLSGEQGWNAQLSRSAQLLASQGALVAGIDSRALFADLERDGAECVFPDGDLENLSHFLQAYYRLPSYEPAVLVGHGTRATLSYAMLAQAPAETFAGGVSIDFCPQLRLRKQLCEAGTLQFTGTKKEHSTVAPAKLEAPWIAVQTRAAGACGSAVTQRFVTAAPGSQLVQLPEDKNSANWEAEVSAAVRRRDPSPRPNFRRRRMGRHRQSSRCCARRAGHRRRRRRFAAIFLEGAHAAEHSRRRRSHRAPLHGGVGQEGRSADRLFTGRGCSAVRRESTARADARARAPGGDARAQRARGVRVPSRQLVVGKRRWAGDCAGAAADVRYPRVVRV